MPVLFDGPLMAEYHQFYVSDAASLTTLPTQWTEQDVERRILAGEHGVIISTARNMPVAVRVELHAHQPALDPARVDHAVTASFRSTGSITIAGLLDYAPAAATASVPARHPLRHGRLYRPRHHQRGWAGGAGPLHGPPLALHPSRRHRPAAMDGTFSARAEE